MQKKQSITPRVMPHVSSDDTPIVTKGYIIIIISIILLTAIFS